MGEVAAEIEHAVLKLHDWNLNIDVMSFCRDFENSLIRIVNNFYRNLTRWHVILFFRTVKLS